MKIISWNVNGFRSIMRKGSLASLIFMEDPDIVFLQEIKCSKEDFDRAASGEFIGYFCFVQESAIPGRHGTAILIKEELYYEDVGEEIARVSVVPNKYVDPLVEGQRESRIQAMNFNGLLILNTYTVNVRQDLSRLGERKAYDNHLANLVQSWKDQSEGRVLVLGDFNVVSDVTDYHGPRLNPNVAGMTDSERASFEDLLKAQKMVDTFRHFNPEEIKYSYWSYRGYARENNSGWRLDYALASEELMPLVKSSDILTSVYGSDHAPIVVELSEEVL